VDRSAYYPPLVISIHGILTHGEWQKVFASGMSTLPTQVESFYYGYYGLLRFLTPPFNKRMVDKFYNWYALAVKSCRGVDLERYDKRPSVVAHSLGSWIVGNAMLKHEDMRFDKLILAGSILPRDFDWMTLFARDQVDFVRNECGKEDRWPRRARRFVAGTGTGGSEGFEWFGRSVDNVRCEWSGHSDPLMRQHIEKHWLPVLRQAPSPLALLHGRDIHDGDRFSEILDHTGTIIDDEAFGNLLHYPEAEIPRGLSLTWIKVNPDIYTFLIDRQTRRPAGYINAMPVDDALYSNIRAGRVADNKVPASSIRPFLPTEKNLKIYLMSIAIAEKYRRWGDGILQQAYVQLLTGFLDKLFYYAKNHGIRATHFLATAWTDEGRKMCEFFAMTEVGKDEFGDSILELDLQSLQYATLRKIPSPLRRLLQLYRQLKDQ
jgi:pimeloyl-ACP methyl ester carboxylesterase